MIPGLGGGNCNDTVYEGSAVVDTIETLYFLGCFYVVRLFSLCYRAAVSDEVEMGWCLMCFIFFVFCVICLMNVGCHCSLVSLLVVLCVCLSALASSFFYPLFMVF